jgi:hypothetical protein
VNPAFFLLRDALVSLPLEILNAVTLLSFGNTCHGRGSVVSRTFCDLTSHWMFEHYRIGAGAAADRGKNE